jgi:hypothetical protein
MKKLNPFIIASAVLSLSVMGAIAQPQRIPPGHGHGLQLRMDGPPPLVKALDANRDGVIDATELANASTALLTLDTNKDGQLTGNEFQMRPPMGGRPPLPKELVTKYDTDQDGQLSASEREALDADIESGKIQPPPAVGFRHRKGPPPAELMEKYDTDQDGVLSEEERQSLDQDVQSGNVPRPPRPPRAPAHEAPQTE